jgi:peptidoglycan hydrolase-like protein with peptidoglycan-binding domain
MKIARRLALTLVIAAIVSVLGYGAGWGLRSASIPSGTPDAGSTQAGPAIGGDEPDTTQPPDIGTPTSDPIRPAQDPTEEPTEEPAEEPGPRLMGPGDEGDRVRRLQARLRQIDWFEGDVTGVYGDITAEAVRGFQAKREIPVTGEVDERTLDRLHGMTTEPTPAELSNQVPSSNGNAPGPLDPRCTTGRVLCVDKSSSTLRWVVDGEVRQTVDTRFGGSSTPTREGVFSVYLKSRDHVSSLYDTSMPFAMFFSGGQAVHYSPDFAAAGYNGASHGCVNVRDYDGIAALYDRVMVGDKVVVYWS